MKKSVIFGLCTIFVLWLALSIVVLVTAGFTLYNLIVIALAAAIIFVPLWKKYLKKE